MRPAFEEQSLADDRLHRVGLILVILLILLLLGKI
jgi:hypothetical protein